MHDLWKRSAEKEVVQAQTIVVAAPKEFFVEKKKKKLGFLSKHFPLIDRLYLSELKKSNTSNRRQVCKDAKKNKISCFLISHPQKYILTEIPIFLKANTSVCNQGTISLGASALCPIPPHCHQPGPSHQTSFVRVQLFAQLLLSLAALSNCSAAAPPQSLSKKTNAA